MSVDVRFIAAKERLEIEVVEIDRALGLRQRKEKQEKRFQLPVKWQPKRVSRYPNES